MNSAHMRVRLIFRPFGWPDDVMHFRLPLDLPRKPCNVWLGMWVGGRHFPFQPTPASVSSLSGVWYCSVPISPATPPSLMCFLSLASPTCYRNPAELQSPLQTQSLVTSQSTLFRFPSWAEQESEKLWSEITWKALRCEPCRAERWNGSAKALEVGGHSSKIFYWGISPSTAIFPFSI